jgi:hypothetical protein
MSSRKQGFLKVNANSQIKDERVKSNDNNENYHKKYMFHEFMMKKPLFDTDVIQTEIIKLSEEIIMQNSSGMLPFHLAAAFQPTSIVESISTKYPGASRARNVYNDLPLHCALSYGSCIDAKLFLVNSDPETCALRNGCNKLPLEIVCENLPSSTRTNELVSLLLSHYPEACAIPNSFGQYPLHLTLGKHPVSTTGLLFYKHPEVVKYCDEEGNYPIHLLMKYQGRFTMFSTTSQLMKTYPRAIHTWKSEGFTSKHSYQGDNTSAIPESDIIDGEELLKLAEDMIAEYPDALAIPNEKGLLPYHLLMESNGSCPKLFLALFSLLVKAYPPSVKISLPNGVHPIELWQKNQSILRLNDDIHRRVLSIDPKSLDPLSMGLHRDLNYRSRRQVLLIYVRMTTSTFDWSSSMTVSKENHILVRIVNELCIDAMSIARVGSYSLPNGLLKIVATFL